MFSRFMQVIAGIFLWLDNAPFVDILFMPFSTGGRLGCSHLLTSVNNDAVNICVPFCRHACFSP